jgi:hypothetical protein
MSLRAQWRKMVLQLRADGNDAYARPRSRLRTRTIGMLA